MNYIIFGVVLLHLVLGFGWLIYKLEFQKKDTKDQENTDIDLTK